MKLLIIFIYLITINSSHAFEKPDLKNLVLTKNPKLYEEVVFMDLNQKNVNLDDFKGKLIILNFWATWCAPCKEEMPSLDNLQIKTKLNNLKIFAINIGQEDLTKSEYLKEIIVSPPTSCVCFILSSKSFKKKNCLLFSQYSSVYCHLKFE